MGVEKKIFLVGTGRWANVYLKYATLLKTRLGLAVEKMSTKDYLESSGTNKSGSERKDKAIIIICNSTSMHYQCARHALNKSDLILTEKPCFKTLEEYEMFDHLLCTEGIGEKKVFISCPFLFNPKIQQIKKHISNVFVKELVLNWYDNEGDLEGKSRDKDTRQTALCHYIPIIGYLMNLEGNGMNLQKIESDGKETQLRTAKNKSLIRVNHLLGAKNKAREIEVVTEGGTTKYDLIEKINNTRKNNPSRTDHTEDALYTQIKEVLKFSRQVKELAQEERERVEWALYKTTSINKALVV